MLLDRLLSHLSVEVEPFALCLLSDGWRMRLPGPPSSMLHFVLEGTGAVLGERDDVHALAPFCLVVVPRGAAHALESGGSVQHERRIDVPASAAALPHLIAGSSHRVALKVACGLVRVRYGESLGLFDHLRDVLAIDLSDVPQVHQSFQGILAEQALPGPGADAMKKALMTQCLVEALRHLCREADCGLPWLAALEHAQLAPAIDRLIGDPAARHTVDSLAGIASMGRSAFMERFVAAFGRPPMRFLHDVRMQHAARLLRTDARLSLDEIAGRVGYASRSHFSHTFSRHYGTTPTAFRSAH